MCILNIYINNNNDEFILDSIQCDETLSIRQIITDYIDCKKIEHTTQSIIFRNIKEELTKYSKVVFIGNVQFDVFLDESISSLLELFEFNELNLIIDIGGIGGAVAEENGIVYYIYSRNEHPPKHVHCMSQRKKCKCYLDTFEIEDEYKNHNTFFNSSEKKAITNYVMNNLPLFEHKWDELNPNLSSYR